MKVEKMIPRVKMGKRQKREDDLAKRQVWDVNPITKVIPNKKKYDRKKDKKVKEDA